MYLYSLNTSTEALEAKCEEISKQIADLKSQKLSLQRQYDKLSVDRTSTNAGQKLNTSAPASGGALLRPFDHFDGDAHVHHHDNSTGPESLAYAFRSASNSFGSSSMYGDDVVDGGDKVASDVVHNDEEYSNVVAELNVTRRQWKDEQQRVNDLEDQLNALSKKTFSIF